jgi:hypothetical protein
MHRFRSARRQFLVSSAFAALAAIVPRPLAALAARRARGPHPAPRPGVNASKVLTAAQLADDPDAIAAFDAVRSIPSIADGIRCHCGCAAREGFYSLLSCYEGEGMARMCLVCQGEGRMAERMHRQGRSLDEIRAAIDTRYG